MLHIISHCSVYTFLATATDSEEVEPVAMTAVKGEVKGEDEVMVNGKKKLVDTSLPPLDKGE